VRDLKKLYPDRSFSRFVIPLMRIVKKGVMKASFSEAQSKEKDAFIVVKCKELPLLTIDRT